MPTRFEMALKHKDETSKLLSFASIILMSKNMEFKEEDIFYNEYKKPMLKDIYFNLSHSGDYAIFVKDKLPIGVDIQIINKNNLDIKKNAFTKNEIEYIDKDEINNFFEIWTKKESLLKAVGTGFTTMPNNIGIDMVDTDNGITYKDAKYYMKTKKFENYYISVCAKREFDDIVIVEQDL